MSTLAINWLQVFGVSESVVQYGEKAGENAMRLKRQDAVPGVTIKVFRPDVDERDPGARRRG
jgi:hypothetical protein